MWPLGFSVIHWVDAFVHAFQSTFSIWTSSRIIVRLSLGFFMLNSVSVVWPSFPPFWPCGDTHSATHVDCRMRNLTSIPAINSLNVTEFDLYKNRLTLITYQSFSGVPNLTYLNLNWNCLPGNLNLDKKPCRLTIEQNAFVDLLHLKTLRLAANSLTVVPLLPPNLQELYLELNNIVVLGHQNLSRIFNLQILDLGMNCFYQNPCGSSLTFVDDTFTDAHSLKNLTLGFNNLTRIPVGLPSTLISLDLSENQIPEIRSSDFENLTNLEHLDLRWNCQRCDHAAMPCFPCLNNSALQIHPDTLKYVKKLKELNLRGNSLQNLPDSLFEPLTNLIFLELSDNFLAFAIANGTFFSKLRTVQVLMLNYNYKPLNTFLKLTLSPYMKNMSSLRYVAINGYFFKNLDEDGIAPLLSLSQLQNITFRTNFIESVNLSLFSNFSHLKLIDLSENLLTLSKPCKSSQDDPEVLPLRLSQDVSSAEQYSYLYDISRVTDIHKSEYNSFYLDYPTCGHNNKTIDLSFNNLNKIEAEDFRGLKDIECLNLSYNYINQRLNGSQFSYLKSLRLLDVSYNRFDLYYNKSFNELPNLEVLYLNSNQFQFMFQGLGHSFNFLENMTSLKFLSLSRNTIGIRISNQLRCPSLKVLVFKYNRLNLMWEGGKETYLNIFTNLVSLETLDISHNNMQSIPSKVLNTLPKSLKKLYITNNKLRIFDWKAMNYLPNLEILDLSHNVLTYLDNETVPWGSNFTFLNLGSNQITSLNSGFFSNFNSLKYLILSDNKIKFIMEDSFPKGFLLNLKSLDVSGNPFSCTCEAHWFLYFLNKTLISIDHVSNGLMCDSPDSKRGQYLFSTDPQSCEDINGQNAFISTIFIVLLLTVLPILKKLFGWDIWYSIHIFKAALRKDYTSCRNIDGFDAFIAFDTKQNPVTDWVYNELVPHLEEDGSTQFKLCLEQRDWVAGRSMIENLCDAVYKSKKTVFILAADGFASGLLRHTFFMAQQRLLDERLDVAILVLLDKGMKMSKYLLSRKRVCKKSVLDWPGNPKAQPYFWHSLRVLLAQDSKHWYDPDIRKSINS